jgi:DNA-binding transcriptional ArsR family regulator
LQEFFRKSSFDSVTEPPTYRRLRDPRELAALAHPVRIGIMELLTVSGPLTATELADRLDETPANCSWHLRKLAEHHFEEDASPAQVRAGRALEQMFLERQVTRFHQARAQLHDDGDVEWGEASTATQSASWLTLDELDEINSEIRAVLERYVDRVTDPAKRPAGARLCEFVAWGAPLLLPGVETTPDATEAGADAS